MAFESFEAQPSRKGLYLQLLAEKCELVGERGTKVSGERRWGNRWHWQGLVRCGFDNLGGGSGQDIRLDACGSQRGGEKSGAWIDRTFQRKQKGEGKREGRGRGGLGLQQGSKLEEERGKVSPGGSGGRQRHRCFFHFECAEGGSVKFHCSVQTLFAKFLHVSSATCQHASCTAQVPDLIVKELMLELEVSLTAVLEFTMLEGWQVGWGPEGW